MGILNSSKHVETTPTTTKRRSAQMDFSNLGPLKPGGTVGFSAFRDAESSAGRKLKSRKKSSAGVIAEDSDDEDDDEDDDAGAIGKMDDLDDKDIKPATSAEDAKYSGELAAGVGRIKVCS